MALFATRVQGRAASRFGAILFRLRCGSGCFEIRSAILDGMTEPEPEACDFYDPSMPSQQVALDCRNLVWRRLLGAAESCVGHSTPALRFQALAYVLGVELFQSAVYGDAKPKAQIMRLGVEVQRRALGDGFSDFCQRSSSQRSP